MDFNINYLAVLVAGISNMVIGGLWYGPLFMKPWSKEMGFDKRSPDEIARMKAGSKTAYPQAFVGALLTAVVLAHVMQAFGADSIAGGLTGAFWSWLGFIVPVKYGDKLWGGKSFKLFFIEVFYYLVSLSVMSIILVSWM